MNASIKGKNLVIEIPLQEPQASKTGKTLVVASSRGNVKTTAMINGQNITIGLNAYIPVNGMGTVANVERFQATAA